MIKGQKECFKTSNRSVLKTLLYLVTIKFGGEVLVYDIFEVLNKDLIIRHRYKEGDPPGRGKAFVNIEIRVALWQNF